MPRQPCSPIDQAIGRNIRFHRMRCGMTQADLAAVLGVSFQQIQKYENGRNHIAASRLVKVAARLDVMPAILLKESDPDQSSTHAGFESIVSRR